MKVQKPTYTAYFGNVKLWEIQAHHLEGTSPRIKVTDIQGVLWKNGKKRYELKSSSAFINLLTNDIYFPHGAVFENEKEKIQVHVLLWRAKDKKFFGTKGVRITRLNSVVNGDTLVLDRNMKEIRIKGHVKADVIP